MSQREESKVSMHQNVLAEVADVLSKSTFQVRERLVKDLTERELQRRVGILDKALGTRNKFQQELESIKPPGEKLFQVVDGKTIEVLPVYTQEELKKFNDEVKTYNRKLNEATDRLNKFDSLLEEAFTNPSNKVFSKLSAMISGKTEEVKTD